MSPLAVIRSPGRLAIDRYWRGFHHVHARCRSEVRRPRTPRPETVTARAAPSVEIGWVMTFLFLTVHSFAFEIVGADVATDPGIEAGGVLGAAGRRDALANFAAGYGLELHRSLDSFIGAVDE